MPVIRSFQLSLLRAIEERWHLLSDFRVNAMQTYRDILSDISGNNCVKIKQRYICSIFNYIYNSRICI